jgi:hypothetical protein
MTRRLGTYTNKASGSQTPFNDGERLRFVSTMDLPGLEPNLPATQCDKLQTWIPRESTNA